MSSLTNCRVCFKTENVLIPILSQHSIEHKLQKRMKDYLQIDIDPTDQFPKYICYKCVRDLEIVQKILDESKKSEMNWINKTDKDDFINTFSNEINSNNQTAQTAINKFKNMSQDKNKNMNQDNMTQNTNPETNLKPINATPFFSFKRDDKNMIQTTTATNVSDSQSSQIFEPSQPYSIISGNLVDKIIYNRNKTETKKSNGIIENNFKRNHIEVISDVIVKQPRIKNSGSQPNVNINSMISKLFNTNNTNGGIHNKITTSNKFKTDINKSLLKNYYQEKFKLFQDGK